MDTEVLKLGEGESYWRAIRRAASALASGGLVGFPTETVYGVGANAGSSEAVVRLRQVKQRPANKPFTVHIGRRQDVEQFVPNMSAVARRMVEKGWPGPLTLIFSVGDLSSAPVMTKLGERHSEAVYHNGTVGVRCPDSKHASDLLLETKMPVVAASANVAGHAPPLSAEEALEDLGGQIDMLLDGGTTRYAKPSTVVRLNNDSYELVRSGVLDERTIKRLTTVNFLFVCSGNTCRSPMAASLCRRMLAERLGCPIKELAARGYQVLSAGAYAFEGGRASQDAQNAMRARSLDIGSHATHPLTVELINQADHIFTMTDAHRDKVITMVPSAESRSQRLDANGNIDDPIGSGDKGYSECAERIEAALRIRLEETSL